MSGNIKEDALNPDFDMSSFRGRRVTDTLVRRSFDPKNLDLMMIRASNASKQPPGISEMFLHLYETGKLSDISLEVGTSSNSKTFHVHKLILSISSSVFKNWFYNIAFEPNATVKVRDVEPEDFETLLRFIYYGDFQAGGMTNVIRVIKIAKRFDVRRHIDACHEYIAKNITIRNVWDVYEMVSTESDNKAYSLVKKLISESPVVFEMSEFRKFKATQLEALVKDIAPIVDNNSLVKGLNRWANSIVLNSKELSIMEVFTPFLPHIRFMDLTADEFADCVGHTGIISDEDYDTILSNLSGIRKTPLPSWCCRSSVQRPVQHHKLQLSFLSKRPGSLTKKGITLCCRFKVLKENILINGVAAKVVRLVNKKSVDIDKAKVWFQNENPNIQEKVCFPGIERNGDILKFTFPCSFPLNKGEECTIQLAVFSDEQCKYIWDDGRYQEKSVVIATASPFIIVRCLTPKLEETYGLISTVFLSVNSWENTDVN